MIILACETSTLLGSVAVVKDGAVLAERQLMRQGSHSDILNPFIYECLNQAGLTLQNIDCFATGIGPGSFTGIRISLNTAKTFGYVLDKSVYGESSLKILAFQAQAHSSHITAMINAYKNMVYIAQYEVRGSELIEVLKPQVLRVQELGAALNSTTLAVGDGFLAYEKYFSADLKRCLTRNANATDHPTASALALLAQQQKRVQHWSTLLPLYLRASEAEENLQGIKYQPL